MLTKEERAAIAERANRAKYNMDSIFEILHGYSSPEYMSLKDDFIAMVTRVLDLCDTSNMLELPVDKDGEAIHIGDTVYDKDDNLEYKVKGYLTRRNNIEIILDATKLTAYTTVSAEDLTHKKPGTIASLVGEIRRTLSQNTIMNKEATSKLWEIADQIEMLSDGND